MEEALEQLAVLAGAEAVDDITEKFKVTHTCAPPESVIKITWSIVWISLLTWSEYGHQNYLVSVGHRYWLGWV